MAALRTPGSLALAAAAALALILVSPAPVRGCSCENSPLSEYADGVAAAFSGNQIERIEHTGSGWNDTTLVFEVRSVYKGRVGPLIEIGTQAYGATCGADFDGLGFTGVAAFEDDDGELLAHLCGSHVFISELEEVFGPGRPPDETVTPDRENPDETTAAARPQATDAGATAAAAAPEEGGVPGAAVVLITVAAVLLAGGAAAILRRRGRLGGK